MPVRPKLQVSWFLIALAMPAPAVVLLSFAVLREQPEFWRNTGGWPLWLRDLVLVSFYPLLAAHLCALAILSFFAFGGNSESSRGTRLFQGILLLGLWMLAASAIATAFFNNIMNLLNGQSLHSHGAF